VGGYDSRLCSLLKMGGILSSVSGRGIVSAAKISGRDSILMVRILGASLILKSELGFRYASN
jgi:hypothetical protein